MEFPECAVGLYLDSVAGSGCIIWCSVSSCKRDLGNTGFNQDIILFADTCLVSSCMLLAYVIVLVCIWSRIPGTVPTHFNAAGIADSYGGKGILWIEVIVAAVILLLLSLIEKVPSIWNFPVAVTEENKERLYKIALVMLGAIKILTTGLFIDVGVSSLVTRFPVWPMYIMLGAMVIVIVVAVVQMIRAK